MSCRHGHGRRANTSPARGTGYFIAEGGYLLTNHHVIHNNKKMKVRLAGRAEPVPAKLIAADVDGDIALLKAEIPEGSQNDADAGGPRREGGASRSASWDSRPRATRGKTSPSRR